jgi:predicted DNA-binding transcriptional regulator AlpA
MSNTDCLTARVEKTLADHRQNEEDELGINILAHRLPELHLRIDQLVAITGLSIPTIYRQMKTGAFPRPYKITPSKNGAKAWRLSEIMTWMGGLERAEDETP